MAGIVTPDGNAPLVTLVAETLETTHVGVPETFFRTYPYVALFEAEGTVVPGVVQVNPVEPEVST